MGSVSAQGKGWQQQLGSGEWGQAEHPPQGKHLGQKAACGWVTKQGLRAGWQQLETAHWMGWFDFWEVQPFLPSTALA